MSPLHKLFARPTGRRECRTMRPMLEILERRDCPTVTAAFNPVTGVLTVVGDGGNNVIELFQPRDRVVEVMGDGEKWVFEGVGEVIVDAGEGDDQATSSKPKEIVVVGSKIHIDVGAGNDTVKIDDGGPLEVEPNFVSTMNYSLNLGTGADALRVAAENSGILNLSVQSADGFDRHELGHTLGFRHEHTRPESNVRMDLTGSGSHMDVDFDNIEQVDLSIVSQPVPGEPAAEGAVFVRWHVFGHDSTSTFIGRNDGSLQLVSLSGGSASGVSPTALSFSATAGGASIRPLATVSLSGSGSDPSTSDSAGITTGDTDDTVSILSDNVDLQLAADLGAGDDSFAGNYRLANGSKSIVDVAGGAGRDTVAHAAEYTEDIAPIDFAGAFHATTTAEVVDLELHNAPVGADLDLHVHRYYPAVRGESDASRASLHLAPGEDVLHDDVLIVDVVSFEQVDLHLATAPNPDRPEKIDLATVTYDDPAGTSVRLADRDDGVRLEAANWSEVHLGYETLEPTIPTPDPQTLAKINMISVMNHAAADTSVLLADGDDGLHVEAANFSETRLALEAGYSSPIVPGDPDNLQLVSELFDPAAGSRGPGEFVIPSLVRLDVDPSVPEATLLTEFSGPGNVEVAGQFPAAAGSEERPTFVSKLRVEDADPLATSSSQLVFPWIEDPYFPALDVDASLAAATAYEFENEAENIPAVRFALNAPDQDGVVLLNSSLPGGSSAGSSPVSNVRVTFTESLDAGGALLLDVATGDQDDVVDASASGFETVVLNANTGGGADLIGWDFSHRDTDPAAPSIESHQRGVDTRATIDLGAGDDALSFVNADANSIQLSLKGGDGNDSAIIDGTSNTIVFAERFANMLLDLGAGNDQLALKTTDFPVLEVDLTAGEGDDDVQTRNQVRTTALWGVRSRIHLGAGNDRLQTEVEGYGNVDTLVAADAGDDEVAYKCTGCRSFSVDESGVIYSAADLGAGNDRLKLAAIDFDQALIEVLAGEGDDEVEIEAQSGEPFSFVRDPRGTGMVVDLGEGANQLKVETGGLDKVMQDFRSGDGIDQIEVADRAGPFFDFKATRLQQSIRTGGGNDIVLNDTEGRQFVTTTIETGAGHDSVWHNTAFYHLLPATAHVAISLGAGDDVAALDVLGFSQIAMAIHTGPTGDGRDLIVGTISLSPLDRLKRLRRVLDGRQDLVELFVSAGYDVQVIGDETTLIVIFTRSGLITSFPEP